MDRKAQKRDALLRAARTVFATKGYHLTKIDDIVAAADVAKGTFYLYFRDKRTVFEELVDTLVMKLQSAIIEVDVHGDVEAQVKHNIRAILAVLLDESAPTPVLLSHGAGLDATFVARIEEFAAAARAMLSAALTEGQRLGIVAPGDASLQATFTLGALKEILHEANAMPRARSREEIVGALYDFLQSGYLRVAGAQQNDRPVSRGSRVAG